MRKKPKKINHLSTKTLRKTAWKLQSEYLRRYEKGICFTCGIRKPWKQQNAGHYIHKDCLDYDPINIHCQCVHCNKYLHGNTGVYAERLIAEFGLDAILDLRRRAEQIRKFTVRELQETIDHFKIKLMEMEDEN